MSAIAGPIISGIEGALEGASSAGSGQEGQDVFNANIADMVKEVAEGVLWVFGQVYGSWKWSYPRSQQIGRDFETIQGANQSAILHLTEQILPNSLAYLEGYIFSHGIVPLRRQVATLDTRVKALVKWQGEIDAWRKHTVDPAIAQSKAFIAAFNRDDRPAINTLRGWLKDPGVFAKWAAPFLIPPLVGNLATDHFTRARDTLALMLVQSWNDETNAVWEGVLQWVVSDK